MITTDIEFERQLVLLALEVAANHFDQKAREATWVRYGTMADHYKNVAKEIREVKVELFVPSNYNTRVVGK